MSFDLKTHIRDKKGQIIGFNHYTLHINEGIQMFERPPGSGNMYDATGKLVKEGEAKKQEQVSSGPESDAQAEIQALKAELEALKQKALSPQEAKAQVAELLGEEVKKPTPTFSKK